MVGCHHWVNAHGFEQALRACDGQGSQLCCSLWSCKGSDTTGQLNWRRIESHSYHAVFKNCHVRLKDKYWPEFEGIYSFSSLCHYLLRFWTPSSHFFVNSLLWVHFHFLCFSLPWNLIKPFIYIHGQTDTHTQIYASVCSYIEIAMISLTLISLNMMCFNLHKTYSEGLHNLNFLAWVLYVILKPLYFCNWFPF